MNEFYLGISAFLLITLLLGFIRIYKGPAPADRLLSAQLFATTTTAIILILAETTETSALRDVTLLLTLLAAILSIAFVRASPKDETNSDARNN